MQICLHVYIYIYIILYTHYYILNVDTKSKMTLMYCLQLAWHLIFNGTKKKSWVDDKCGEGGFFLSAAVRTVTSTLSSSPYVRVPRQVWVKDISYKNSPKPAPLMPFTALSPKPFQKPIHCRRDRRERARAPCHFCRRYTIVIIIMFRRWICGTSN